MPLPFIEFQIAAGLYTKARQDDVSALVQATNVDFFGVAGRVGKVPGIERRSDTASPAATWQSIHHHEGLLSGTLTRMQVGLCGTILRRIASDQTLLTLTSGLTSEPLFGVSSQDRLHLCSANNTPIKVTLDNVVSNWGIPPPTSAPTLALGASGNIPSGTYRYVVTYVSTYGKESNRSDPSDSIQANNNQISLTAIPTSPEAQVTSRKLYRDDGGDAIYRLVTTISDNTTTTYTDNSSVADLSSDQAPEAAGPEDNSAPETMAFVASYDAYIFGVLASDRRTVVYTESNEPEYWPTLNARTFPQEVTALSPILGGLLIEQSDRIIAVTGGEGGSRTLQFNEVNPELGCVGARAVVRAKQAIFQIHDDGPHLTTSGDDDWYLGAPIRDLIDDLDNSTFADSFLVNDRTRYRVLWFVDSDCFVYSYGNQGTGEVSPEGAGVDPLDLRRGKWSKLSLPISIASAAVIETASDTPEVWLGGTGGIIYRITDTVANYAIGSTPSAISSTIETTYEKLVQGPDKHGMFRYLVAKGSGDSASTWTCTLTGAVDAGGSALRSTSFSVVVGPGVTSKKYAVPRGIQGPYAKVKFENSALGETGVIEAARLHFVTRPIRGER